MSEKKRAKERERGGGKKNKINDFLTKQFQFGLCISVCIFRLANVLAVVVLFHLMESQDGFSLAISFAEILDLIVFVIVELLVVVNE